MKPLLLSRTINFISGGRLKFGWWSSGFQSDANPIFIGGASRSGTSLLTSLLSAHPQIHIGPETGIFEGNRDCDHLSRITELPIEWLRCQLIKCSCQAELMEQVLIRQASNVGKNRWGEKTPGNVRHLQRIFQWFPEARFIHIIRDGRDVACSLRTHPEYVWVNGKYVRSGVLNPWPECVAEWAGDIRAGIAWRSDARYFEIFYEELVSFPQRTMMRLLEWLGHGWSEEILTNYRRSGMPNHRALAGPITQSAVSRWRSDLPVEARELFRGANNQLLKDLHYVDGEGWIDQGFDSIEIESVKCHLS